MKTMRMTAIGSTIAAAIVLGGCATSKPTPELEAARSAVSAARSDSAVVRDAPLELERAERSLREAEAQWSDHGEDPRTAHAAYLARQRALIAREVATQRASQQEVQSASAERDRVLLEVRTRESAAARQRADQAQVQAMSAEQQAAQAREQNAQLQAKLAELSSRDTPRGLVVTLGDVLFEVGRAELRPQAAREIDRLAEALRQETGRRVEIEGHTDSTGSEGLNQQLSERRAEAVREALISRGVEPSRVIARGLGEGTPVATNDTASGRALNRRVEVVISGSPTASRTN